MYQIIQFTDQVTICYWMAPPCSLQVTNSILFEYSMKSRKRVWCSEWHKSFMMLAIVHLLIWFVTSLTIHFKICKLVMYREPCNWPPTDESLKTNVCIAEAYLGRQCILELYETLQVWLIECVKLRATLKSKEYRRNTISFIWKLLRLSHWVAIYIQVVTGLGGTTSG